ncbi:hypothetical protein BJ170DRAFT_162453 [Xylariales sp. AK1849]|nr:hypothetical protein BJ170DRAFT_162453 [Xylariales sp. AK1849]
MAIQATPSLIPCLLFAYKALATVIGSKWVCNGCKVFIRAFTAAMHDPSASKCDFLELSLTLAKSRFSPAALCPCQLTLSTSITHTHTYWDSYWELRLGSKNSLRLSTPGKAPGFRISTRALYDETPAGTSHRVTCTPSIDDQMLWSNDPPLIHRHHQSILVLC